MASWRTTPRSQRKRSEKRGCVKNQTVISQPRCPYHAKLSKTASKLSRQGTSTSLAPRQKNGLPSTGSSCQKPVHPFARTRTIRRPKIKNNMFFESSLPKDAANMSGYSCFSFLRWKMNLLVFMLFYACVFVATVFLHLPFWFLQTATMLLL